MLIRLLRRLFLIAAHLVVALVLLWAAGALYYDLPAPLPVRTISAGVLFLGVGVLWYVGRRTGRVIALALLALVAGWWLTLKPSNDRPWLPDVAQTASAEINGDEVVLHNVRNCDYRTETDYTPHWETRTVRLSQITGIDLAINYWGSPYMAHPIVSFQFADAPPVCFSIETRKEVGESYSAIGGFYRQYELIYIIADERDVIRVRTNFRQGEDIYLYRLNITPEKARGRFRDYLRALNELRDHPRWYNAATTNCTTSIRTQHTASERAPWDWRILVNGFADEMLYAHGALRTGGLPFLELKARSLINERAHAVGNAPAFSILIRRDLPGFP